MSPSLIPARRVGVAANGRPARANADSPRATAAGAWRRPGPVNARDQRSPAGGPPGDAMPVPWTPSVSALNARAGDSCATVAGSRKLRGRGLSVAAAGPSPPPLAPWQVEHTAAKIVAARARDGGA